MCRGHCVALIVTVYCVGGMRLLCLMQWMHEAAVDA